MGNAVRTLTFSRVQRMFAEAGLTWDAATLTPLGLDAAMSGSAVLPDSAGWAGLSDSSGSDNSSDAASSVSLVSSDADNPLLLASDQCPACVDVVVFADEHKSEIVEDRSFGGSVTAQVDDVLAFVMHRESSDRLSGESSGGSTSGHDASDQGSDGAPWPERALREALTNAVVHRDYAMAMPVTVEVYADRLRIVSPGGFPNGLTLGDVLTGMYQPRNPRLLTLMRALGLARGRGTGIPRIVGDYDAAATPPQITVSPHAVSVMLPKPVPAGMRDIAHGGTPGERPLFDPAQHPKVIMFPSPSQPLATARPWTIVDGGNGTMTVLLGTLPPMDVVARTDDGASVPGTVTAPLCAASSQPRSATMTAGLSASARLTAAADQPDVLTADLTEDGAVPQTECVALTTWADDAIVPSRIEEAMFTLLRRYRVGLTRRLIQQELGISMSATYTGLRHLQEQGLVTRVGRSRATRYCAV